MSHYYIDRERVEHICCWDCAIVFKNGFTGGISGDGVFLACECNEDNAQVICDALNAAYAANSES